MRIKELYSSAVKRLEIAQISDPEIEVAVLLGHLLKMNRAQLLLNGDRPVSSSCVKSFEQYLHRRLNHEPSSYITGEHEFWSLPFRITKDVLIPRPETEFLIDTVLRVLGERRNTLHGPLMDLGTGSGVIAVVLALEFPQAIVYGIDYSSSALAVAAENAKTHRVEERVRFINSDWFSGIRPNQSFELIVSNPPYIDGKLLQEDYGHPDDSLQPEVKLYEPRLALDGGYKGVKSIENIAGELWSILKPGGWFFMEMGADQTDHVLNFFQSLGGYERLKIYKDYAGLPRVFRARKTKEKDG